MSKRTPPTGRRFKQANRICDEVYRSIENSTAQAAMFVLWRHADGDGIVRLSASRIATYMAKSERAIQRALADLIRVGALELVEHGGGRHISATYRITGMPRLLSVVGEQETTSSAS